MSDAVLGALAGEALKFLIEEAKKFKNFKPLSRDLASTMERLMPLALKIDSLQGQLDLGVGELKGFKETIRRAEIVVEKCSRVKWFSLHRTKLTREIVEVNEEMLKFCQIELQLLLYRNQLQSMADNAKSFEIVNEKLDHLVASPPVYKDLCSVPKLDFVPVGLDWPLMKVKKKVLDDDVVSLVVSAPPGCGKTTLVTHLCDDKEIKGRFKHIFFKVVSSSPNFIGIVQDLLQHNGEATHAFENDAQAKVALRKLLEKLIAEGPVLLVLDDVWLGAEISFLRNFQIDLKDYKLLVTSRSVLSTLSSSYPLTPLKDEDARSLLIQWALGRGQEVPAEYEDDLRKILKRCNGFPIVIEVVGASLKGQPLSSWKGQVESWSAGETLVGDSTVLKCLQPSFNALKPHLKECFMDLGSFLEDQKIRASVIIDIWVGLYGDGNDMYMKYLNDLASQNLLKLVPLEGNGQEDGFYNELLVTQHDILRELAICQSKSEENLKRKRLNLEIKKNKFPDCLDLMQPINAQVRLLSISTDNAFSSKWVEVDCPNVEALVLNLSSPDYALPSFIAKMKKLKVLTITNHGFFPARLSNFSCLKSLPSLERIRLEKVSITSLDLLQLGLDSLEKLSLVMCGFGEVFYDDIEEIDVSRALPSLQEIDIDYCYDLVELPFWIPEVVSLKTLSIRHCNKLTELPEALGNLTKLEVLRLSSCINLVELPETTERLSNLRFLDISDCLGLRKLPLEIGKLRELKKISMKKCWRCELPDSVKNLEDLVVKCDEETRLVLWERLKKKMKKLRVIVEETDHNLNLLHTF